MKEFSSIHYIQFSSNTWSLTSVVMCFFSFGSVWTGIPCCGPAFSLGYPLMWSLYRLGVSPVDRRSLYIADHSRSILVDHSRKVEEYPPHNPLSIYYSILTYIQTSRRLSTIPGGSIFPFPPFPMTAHPSYWKGPRSLITSCRQRG